MNQILTTLAEILITSGIIWAATMLFKKVLRSWLSPKAHLAVWLVLIARLVLPVTFDTGLHLVTVPSVWQLPAAAEETDVPAEPVHPQVGYSGAALSVPAAERAADDPVQAAPRVSAGPDAQPAEAPRAAVRWDADPAELLVSFWILGALASAAVSVRAYDLMRRDVRRRLVPGSAPVSRLFQETLCELGIRRRVVLAVQNELAGPALMFPNIVLIPENLLSAPPLQVRMALRHELTHFVRRDQYKAVGLSVLRAVWWFNPFAWVAVRNIREDIETACDQDVVGRLDKAGKAAYAGTVLAMFGRTETNQAVLGMAFGGARKNAERRIRGIYMKTKSRLAGKAAALLMAGVLGVACFTTACQPTPATEAVVNQKEGIPEDALVGASETVDPQATTAPAAEYTVAERWDETIDKADNFKVTADVDILTPDVEAYPVEKLAPRDLTQELADQLIDFFAPDAEFYQIDQVRTKAEWEELLVSMREVLADDQARGDQDAVAEDQAILDEWTAMYEQAPEVAERTPVTTEYTYMRDYTGAVMEEEGPIHINVKTDAPDGSVQQISVRRRNTEDPMQFPYFMYIAAEYVTEQQDLSNQAGIEEERRSAVDLDEPYRSEVLEHADQMEAALARQLPLYDQNPMDLTEAKRRGEQLLEDLGIRGAQVFSADKALWTPYKGEMDLMGSIEGLESAELTQPGVYLEFQRENGGIPCVSQDAQNSMPQSSRTEYSAPFMPEHGIILFDQDWNPKVFQWESPTEPVEIVAPDSNLIPLSEAKDKIAEELYRNELAVSPEYIEEFGLAYDVEEMKLVMGYVDVAGEPDNALAVPAWYVRAQGRQLEPDERGDTILYNIQEVMINALDGAPILMPGTAQSYNYDPENAG